MIKLEIVENINYNGMLIHQGTILNIAPGAGLITCEGLVTGLPEGASPLLSMDDINSEEFKGKFKVMRTKTALMAHAKVLFRKAKGKLRQD